jgi:sigma-E factor negative regulatory protein RseB
VHHIVFSDGLASVSLFIETLGKTSSPKVGYLVQGATNVYATTLDGYQIIVVGEVPEDTVRSIAGAVSFKK